MRRYDVHLFPSPPLPPTPPAAAAAAPEAWSVQKCRWMPVDLIRRWFSQKRRNTAAERHSLRRIPWAAERLSGSDSKPRQLAIKVAVAALSLSHTLGC